MTNITTDVVTLDCGHPATPQGIGTGAAHRLDGSSMCYDCAYASELADMHDGRDTYLAYLSSDGKHITTWTGGELARVTSLGSARNGWHGSKIHYWRATDSHGRNWYGRNGGPGMFTVMRLAKH